MKLFLDKQDGTEGLVFKKKVYELFPRVELTPEEADAYNSVKSEIGQHIVAEYSYKGTELNLTISLLVRAAGEKGFRMAFDSLQERLEAEADIKEGAAGLSNFVKRVMAGSGDEVIDL